MFNKSFFRLGIALVLSASCWLGTEYYYKKSHKNTKDYGDAKPVAYVKDIAEQVERRPVTRIVWHLLDKGDPVFPGEMIKTSDIGEATIQFVDSSRFLNLEPDSLIVISQNSNNEISLDLMDGNIMVGQSQGATPAAGEKMALTLKSGEKKVDLTQATAQLSKSEGKSVDIQVLGGKAKVEGQGQVQELDSAKSLGNVEIISPALDKPQYINPENPAPVAYKWKGLPTTASVQLWAGKSRKELKPYPQVSNVTTESLAAKLPVGKHFWKLVALDKSTGQILQESSIFRTEVQARYSPAITFPLPNSQVKTTVAEPMTEFKWTRPQEASALFIEVAKDPQLKTKVFTQKFTTEESYKHTLPAGDYYWRLSAQYEGNGAVISSAIQKFNVSVDMRPVASAKPDILIAWPETLNTTQHFVTDPVVNLAWSSEQKELVNSWRVKVAENMEDLTASVALDTVKTIETEKTDAKAQLTKPGRYIAMVEALDKNGDVLASSQPKTLEVTPLPLLTAPAFQPYEGELKANNEGRLELNWNKIEGAKEYWLVLFDKTGKELRKAKFMGNSTALVNLLPGEYKVSIYAVDQYGREGEKQELRSVLVPDSSGLAAPKLKKIKVN